MLLHLNVLLSFVAQVKNFVWKMNRVNLTLYPSTFLNNLHNIVCVSVAAVRSSPKCVKRNPQVSEKKH